MNPQRVARLGRAVRDRFAALRAMRQKKVRKTFGAILKDNNDVGPGSDLLRLGVSRCHFDQLLFGRGRNSRGLRFCLGIWSKNHSFVYRIECAASSMLL
jgi:hypothetical protein